MPTAGAWRETSETTEDPWQYLRTMGLIGAGSGSLRWCQMFKAFRGNLIQHRPLGCSIARAGQPLLLVPCSS